MAVCQKRYCSTVEIDIDQCTLRFGEGACPASMGGQTVRKCYNSFETCAAKGSYQKGVNTLKFCEATFPIRNGNYMPILKSVTGKSQKVNLNGFDDQLFGIGERANMSFVFNDMPSNDSLTDKYWDQRISGEAQINEDGYNPYDRGSFWGKFKARNPNFAGRNLRHSEGYIDAGGNFIPERTRLYVIEDIVGPVNGGTVTVKAKDILALADNKKAMAPVASKGKLATAMDINTNVIQLQPIGIGDVDYPSEGWACIGSEVVGFSRSGDTMTLWQRGGRNTVASGHNIDDTVQLCFWCDREPLASVLYRLMVNYGNIPAGYPDYSAWLSEMNVWGLRYVLTGTITKPEEVVKLLGEICKCFAVSVWWNPEIHKIGMKINHAILDDPAREWDDRNNIISMSVETNDSERITRVLMNTVQKDPTKGINEDNFLRGSFDIQADAELPQSYGISRTEVINNRWLNHGDDTFSFILTSRLLARYKRAPTTFTIEIDNKDVPDLTEVIGVSNYQVQDVTGLPQRKLTQVFNIEDVTLGSTTRVKLQEFLFTERYARFAPSDTPRYTSASEYQKKRYMFWSDNNGNMSNGDRGFRWA